MFTSTPSPRRGALVGPIQRSRFGRIEGRQAVRGGDSPQGFPLEARERAAPQARRREGLEPNGRDDKDGTGRSPQSPAVQGTDTPRSVAASFCHMRNKYIWRTKHHFHAKISTIMHNIAN